MSRFRQYNSALDGRPTKAKGCKNSRLPRNAPSSPSTKLSDAHHRSPLDSTYFIPGPRQMTESPCLANAPLTKLVPYNSISVKEISRTLGDVKVYDKGIHNNDSTNSMTLDPTMCNVMTNKRRQRYAERNSSQEWEKANEINTRKFGELPMDTERYTLELAKERNASFHGKAMNPTRILWSGCNTYQSISSPYT